MTPQNAAAIFVSAFAAADEHLHALAILGTKLKVTPGLVESSQARLCRLKRDPAGKFWRAICCSRGCSQCERLLMRWLLLLPQAHEHVWSRRGC